MARVTSLDHLVLTVRDIGATCAFYERFLGMRAETFGDGRTALHFGEQKINLHQAGAEFEPKAAQPTPGSADLCFITDSPIETVAGDIEAAGIEIIDGPVERTGARGRMLSVYFRDPDDNLIEVSRYLDA